MERYYSPNLPSDVIPEELSELIPDELLYNIMIYLPPRTLLTSCRVNSRYNAICSDKPFWKEKLLMDYGVLDIPFNLSDKELYINLTYGTIRKVPVFYAGSKVDTLWVYIDENFGDVFSRIGITFRRNYPNFSQNSLIIVTPINAELNPLKSLVNERLSTLWNILYGFDVKVRW